MGGWRDAEDECTLGVAEHLFDAAEAGIPAEHRTEDGDPRVEVSMTPHAVQLGPDRVEWPIALLLTSALLVVARGVGRRRPPEITTVVRAELTDPGEPVAAVDSWVVSFRHTDLGECTGSFGLFEEAEAFATNLWRDRLATPASAPTERADRPDRPAPAPAPRDARGAVVPAMGRTSTSAAGSTTAKLRRAPAPGGYVDAGTDSNRPSP